jgi:predicted secreted hydrolase
VAGQPNRARHGAAGRVSVRWLQCILLLPPLAACSQATPGPSDRPQTANIGLRYMRTGEDAGFAKAVEPRELTFPIDHGSHPDFRTEWWYFTGTLQAAGGDRYGFELTFFRVALAPAAAAPRPSAWGTGQIWMAHLAVTDPTGQRFVARERMAREAIGLAGVTTEPLRVRVKAWTATLVQNDETETWELDALDEGVRLKLRLATRAPPILNGDHGLDRKGPEPGNASYYYSVPRLATSCRSTTRRSPFAERRGWTGSGVRAPWTRTSRAGTGSAFDFPTGAV